MVPRCTGPSHAYDAGTGMHDHAATDAAGALHGCKTSVFFFFVSFSAGSTWWRPCGACSALRSRARGFSTPQFARRDQTRSVATRFIRRRTLRFLRSDSRDQDEESSYIEKSAQRPCSICRGHEERESGKAVAPSSSSPPGTRTVRSADGSDWERIHLLNALYRRGRGDPR